MMKAVQSKETHFKAWKSWAWHVCVVTALINVSTAIYIYNFIEYDESNLSLIIFVLNSICPIALVFITHNYVYTRKQELQKQSTIIKQEKELNSMAEKLLELQEKERVSIARNLHDDLAQNVAALNLNLHRIKKITTLDSGHQHEAYYSLKDCIELLSKRVSHLISSLRTPDLQNHDFEQVIRDMVFEYENIFLISINLTIKIDAKLESSFIKENLYRAIKEALNNVCKHAKANLITLTIHSLDDKIHAIVEDNGIGISTPMSQTNRNGILGMKERVELMNGEFSINSSKGMGTQVKFEIPIVKNDDREN